MPKPKSNLKYGSIDFKEKVAFFKNKLRLPTATYTDIWQAQHAKAFVVAGAMKDDILTDFQSAVAKAVSGKSTLADFRKDFDNIVSKHGWSYNGKRNWRSKVIYDTNVRTAHSAGRYKQMQAVKRTRPYWQYQHSIASENARDQHLAWHGLVLHADDPWWDTHYPINGYGCQCFVKTLSKRELDKKGLKVSKSPKVEYEDKVIDARTNPRTVRVPKGISPGFDYNVGQASWGKQLSTKAYAEQIAQLKNQSKWQPLNLKTWAEYGRPEKIPFSKLPSKIVNSSLGSVALLEELLGAKEKVFNVQGMPVLVNAEHLASHLPGNREPYFPLIVEALENPYEIWQVFEKHKVSHNIELKRKIISASMMYGKAVNLVLMLKKGVLTSWTMVPMNEKKLNKQRTGELIFSSESENAQK